MLADDGGPKVVSLGGPMIDCLRLLLITESLLLALFFLKTPIDEADGIWGKLLSRVASGIPDP